MYCKVVFVSKVSLNLCYCLLLYVITSCHVSASESGTNYIRYEYKKGDFALSDGEVVANLYVDDRDYQGVQRAASDLQSDIFKVTGIKPKLNSSNSFDYFLNNSANGFSVQNDALSIPVVIGTIGKNRLIDGLIENKKLDVSAIKGKWEGFTVQIVDSPLPAVEKILVIAGADKRGTIFGVYDLAEEIGVSPWYWWADVPVKESKTLFVKAGTNLVDFPVVKYRGIFINDEAPALTGWVNEKYGTYNSQFYEHVFELLLRLKGNYLWPAMWSNAFNKDDPKNRILADEMGIVMGTSHHEPMMRAHKEWTHLDASQKGNGAWNYETNQEVLYDFWRKGVEADQPYESITTLGMRGDGDEPMSEEENIHLLEKIVDDQRSILRDTYGDETKVPQVWTLYKEVQGYYEQGMRVPDDVTLLWSDDNWGNIRRLPTAEERKRKGGAGVYYHFDYVGDPRSYRWINTVPLAKIWEQMNLAYRYEANKIWVVNVGDIKPMELPIDFFLEMAWNPEAFSRDSTKPFGQRWAAEQFGEENAEQIEELLTGYIRHNGRRKPELMEAFTYSQVDYHEAERIMAELNNLVEEAERIYNTLPEGFHDAYFQLVLYPVKASANIFAFYDALAKNRLYARQERVDANVYAEKAKHLFQKHKTLAKQYHDLGGGRWNHFMSQPVISYSYWDSPRLDTMPVLHINEPQPVAEMGVAIEGSVDAWPQDFFLSMDTFTPYGQKQRYIDVFNKGTKDYQFSASVNQPWIKLSASAGEVSEITRLWVSVDWSKAPVGELSGKVSIKGTNYNTADIAISAYKPKEIGGKGFVEADGYISIEAANGQIKNNDGKTYWAEIPQHGRTKSSVAAFAPTDFRAKNVKRLPYIEYPIHLFKPGSFKVHVLAAPSLDFVPDRGLRFAIGLNDKKPVIVDILEDGSHSAWQASVRKAVRETISSVEFTKPGSHKLRIYMVDPGVVIQKLIIDTGGLKPSYLGPPESVFRE